MAKKTAIELLIRELNRRKKVVEQINDVAAYEFGIAIEIAKRYLKKEEEQIEEAFNNSYWFIDGKEYYEKTFK